MQTKQICLNLFIMKTVKSILIFSLCFLFFNSCKKENDVGGGEVSSGKVKLQEYGMQALFPENEWGNQINNEFINIGELSMECIVANLKESGVVIGGNTVYSVHISFMRFVSSFENANEANEMVNFFKDMYDSNDKYSFVSSITLTQVGSYNASKMECKMTNGSIEEDYFIYWKNKLYRIILIMPENKKNIYYTECKEIINTLEITD